ncbi:uncharacterized protein [Primulina eburnea]|uniref:uncharacterized protein n=1 Tax=Primulina eburnea TaxID=1245227 RepID=UPI003C6BF9D6
MSTFGIQGQSLEITVVGCNKLKNTEWITRQDPYVCIEYGSSKFRTRTCKDGGRNPTFQEKFVLSLIEGLREFSVNVWNSNTLTYDDFIGSGKIQLQRVLSSGYDDSAWALQDKRGRHAGEVRLILHFANAYKPVTSHLPQYSLTPASQVPVYSASPVSSYPPRSVPAPPPSLAYPPNPAVYPPPPPPSPSYPPNSAVYPPPPAPSQSYPSIPAVYPPPSYHQPPTYPSTYPPGPSPSVYPPPSNEPHYYPPGLYPPSPYHPQQY